MYGAKVEAHLLTLLEFTQKLKNDVTITRADVADKRVAYSDHVFFTTSDNWRIDRYESMVSIQKTLKEFVQCYERVYWVQNKTMTQRHNLSVLSVVIQDSLDFVEGIVYV